MLDIRRRLYDGDHTEIAASLNNLADAYRLLERYDEARPLIEEALGMTRRLFGDHFRLAVTLTKLGDLERASGHPDDAEAAYRKALAVARRLATAGDPSRLQTPLLQLGQLLVEKGDGDGCAPVLQEALELASSHEASDGKAEEAREWLERCVGLEASAGHWSTGWNPWLLAGAPEGAPPPLPRPASRGAIMTFCDSWAGGVFVPRGRERIATGFNPWFP